MKLRTRFIVPEVIQTSNMDCGPATLKSLLEGFDIQVNYGRLREACQTDVDGTSIDTIEEVANQLGLQAEQIMLPADHLLLEEAHALPCIAVVVLPNGFTHFAVVWRRHGNLVQLMDPAVGRRWTSVTQFLRDLYIHKMPVDAADWREYAGSEDFLRPLRRRIENLKIPGRAETLLAKALQDPEWGSLAKLDAGVRMTEALAASGAISRGPEAARLLDRFLEDQSIPDHYWSVRPSAENGRLLLRGAVVVRAIEPRSVDAGQSKPSSPELIAALEQAPTRRAVSFSICCVPMESLRLPSSLPRSRWPAAP